jgi:hypothetical protein
MSSYGRNVAGLLSDRTPCVFHIQVTRTGARTGLPCARMPRCGTAAARRAGGGRRSRPGGAAPRVPCRREGSAPSRDPTGSTCGHCARLAGRRAAGPPRTPGRAGAGRFPADAAGQGEASRAERTRLCRLRARRAIAGGAPRPPCVRSAPAVTARAGHRAGALGGGRAPLRMAGAARRGPDGPVLAHGEEADAGQGRTRPARPRVRRHGDERPATARVAAVVIRPATGRCPAPARARPPAP